MNDVAAAPTGLLNGLTYSVPIDGVIRMGRVVVRGDRRLPAKDDEFTVTRKHKDDTGAWARHALDQVLREKYGEVQPDGTKKLRRIPVKVGFDLPNLSITEQFAVFSREGRPVCVGNGCTGKRRDPASGNVGEVNCPGPDACPFGRENRCDAFVRLMVQVEEADLGVCNLILRSGSINAVTDCRTVLESLSKLYGGIAELPMWLTLEAKSSSLSRQSTFWYASLRPAFASLQEGARLIKGRREADQAVGMDRGAYEAMLVTLRNNGSFAETGEDSDQIEDLIVARFSDEGEDGAHTVNVGLRGAAAGPDVVSLTNRLMSQAQAQQSQALADIFPPT